MTEPRWGTYSRNRSNKGKCLCASCVRARQERQALRDQLRRDLKKAMKAVEDK